MGAINRTFICLRRATLTRRKAGLLLVAALLAMVILGAAVPAHPVAAAADQDQSFDTQHFTVRYTLSGSNAATEDFARRVGQLAEKAYAAFVTDGGMRPPRDPRPEVRIVVDDPATGGTQATDMATGDVTIKINYRMQSSMDLAGTVAHEVFHAVQFAYMNSDQQPDWAIEGTAPLAAFLANQDVPTAVSEFQNTAYLYLNVPRLQQLTSIDYAASAFWAYMQQRYGGMAYLKNLLEAAANYEWEEAAARAAIQGGAPAGSTFESLFLEFALAMGTGQVDILKSKPAEEVASTIYSDVFPGPSWDGTKKEFATGAPYMEADRDGQSISRNKPLQVPQYAVGGTLVSFPSADPVTIKVGRDVASLRPFLLEEMNDGSLAGAPFPSNGELTLLHPPARLARILLPRVVEAGTGWYNLSVAPAAAGAADTALYSVADLTKSLTDDRALDRATPVKPASSGATGWGQPPAQPPTIPPTAPPSVPPTIPPTVPPTTLPSTPPVTGGTNPPGGYPGGTPGTTGTFQGFPNLPVQLHPPVNITFSDIGGHWAAGTINQLVQLGVTKGFEDGTFKPQATITRAQFITFVVRSFDIAPMPAWVASFGDVPTNHWVSGYVETAVYFGVLKPDEYPGRNFGPDVPITRLEMATIAVRALGLEQTALARASVPLGFADAGDVPANRVGHIATAVDRQIFGGYQEGAGLPTFKPNRTATRAEASAVIIRLLKAAGRLQ